MATIDKLVAELNDAARLARHRPCMAESLVTSIAKKIDFMESFSTADATRLVVAIEQTSLDEPQRTMLGKTVDARLAVSLSNDESRLGAAKWNHSGAPSRDQCIRYLQNFPRLSDWNKLEDPKCSASQRDVVLAQLLTDLGVRRASEEGLIKWAMVILLHVENHISGQWPTYWQIYERVFTPHQPADPADIHSEQTDPDRQTQQTDRPRPADAKSRSRQADRQTDRQTDP